MRLLRKASKDSVASNSDSMGPLSAMWSCVSSVGKTSTAARTSSPASFHVGRPTLADEPDTTQFAGDNVCASNGGASVSRVGAKESGAAMLSASRDCGDTSISASRVAKDKRPWRGGQKNRPKRYEGVDFLPLAKERVHFLGHGGRPMSTQQSRRTMTELYPHVGRGGTVSDVAAVGVAKTFEPRNAAEAWLGFSTRQPGVSTTEVLEELAVEVESWPEVCWAYGEVGQADGPRLTVTLFDNLLEEDIAHTVERIFHAMTLVGIRVVVECSAMSDLGRSRAPTTCRVWKFAERAKAQWVQAALEQAIAEGAYPQAIGCIDAIEVRADASSISTPRSGYHVALKVSAGADPAALATLLEACRVNWPGVNVRPVESLAP